VSTVDAGGEWTDATIERSPQAAIEAILVDLFDEPIELRRFLRRAIGKQLVDGLPTDTLANVAHQAAGALIRHGLDARLFEGLASEAKARRLGTLLDRVMDVARVLGIEVGPVAPYCLSRDVPRVVGPRWVMGVWLSIGVALLARWLHGPFAGAELLSTAWAALGVMTWILVWADPDRAWAISRSVEVTGTRIQEANLRGLVLLASSVLDKVYGAALFSRRAMARTVLQSLAVSLPSAGVVYVAIAGHSRVPQSWAAVGMNDTLLEIWALHHWGRHLGVWTAFKPDPASHGWFSPLGPFLESIQMLDTPEWLGRVVAHGAVPTIIVGTLAANVVVDLVSVTFARFQLRVLSKKHSFVLTLRYLVVDTVVFLALSTLPVAMTDCWSKFVLLGPGRDPWLWPRLLVSAWTDWALLLLGVPGHKAWYLADDRGIWSIAVLPTLGPLLSGCLPTVAVWTFIILGLFGWITRGVPFILVGKILRALATDPRGALPAAYLLGSCAWFVAYVWLALA
jgi:hypothetical protein